MSFSGSLIQNAIYIAQQPPEWPDQVTRETRLPIATGMNRFVWDLRFPPPPAKEHEYPISAIAGDTPREPLGPFVLPGTYTVKLTVDGSVFEQLLTVKMDPRVTMSSADLGAQLALLRRIISIFERLEAEGGKTDAASGAKAKKRGSLEEKLLQLYGVVESADDAPTVQAIAAVEEMEGQLKRAD